MTEKENMKAIFSKIRLSDSERVRIWGSIERKIPQRERNGQKSGQDDFYYLYGRRKGRTALKVAAVVGVVVIGGFNIANFATGGRLAEAMANIWNISRESREIITAATDFHVRLDSVYAPELIEYSDDRIIFGGSFGLLVYDRKEKRVTGTVNLEEIGCNYFNADTKITHFLVEGDRLSVYNLKIPPEVRTAASMGEGLDDTGLKAEDTCYEYDLSACGQGEEKSVVQLKPEKITKDGRSAEERWQEKVLGIRKDTFQSFEDVDTQFEGRTYSEYSLLCGDENTGGKEYAALVLGGTGKDGQGGNTGYSIWIYRQNVNTKAVEKEKLELKVSFQGDFEPLDGQTVDMERLPEFEYHGKNQIKKALVDCFKKDLTTYEGTYYESDGEPVSINMGECDVVIPLIRIAAVKEEGKVTKVFGTFRWEGFTLQGKTLYEAGAETGQTSGGSEAVAYLKNTEDGYEVQKVVIPRDGELLWKDLLKLADGDEHIVKKVYEGDYMKLAAKTLRQYVKDNHLDIRYYKPFGWDPVDISE